MTAVHRSIPISDVAMGERRLGRAPSLLMVRGGQVDDLRELSAPGASSGVELERLHDVSKGRGPDGAAVGPMLPVVEGLGEVAEVVDPCSGFHSIG